MYVGDIQKFQLSMDRLPPPTEEMFHLNHIWVCFMTHCMLYYRMTICTNDSISTNMLSFWRSSNTIRHRLLAILRLWSCIGLYRLAHWLTWHDIHWHHFQYQTVNVSLQKWFALNRFIGYSFGFIRRFSFISYPVWWAFYFHFEWFIWRLVAFLHLLVQLARYSFHSNYTIEQFRWYVLDHVLAFQPWYIHSPPVTHFKC